MAPGTVGREYFSPALKRCRILLGTCYGGGTYQVFADWNFWARGRLPGIGGSRFLGRNRLHPNGTSNKTDKQGPLAEHSGDSHLPLTLMMP